VEPPDILAPVVRSKANAALNMVTAELAMGTAGMDGKSFTTINYWPEDNRLIANLDSGLHVTALVPSNNRRSHGLAALAM